MHNVSCWGPAARALLDRPPFQADVVALLETHVPPREVSDMLCDFDVRGWRGVATPSRPSARADKSGGVAIGARRHLQTETFLHLAAKQEQTAGLQIGRRGNASWTPGPLDFWDFVPLAIRLRSGSLVVVPCYLEPSTGVRGANLTKLAAIGGFVRGLGVDWVVLGDFNVSPEELASSGWLEEVGGVLMLPDVAYTERQGGLLDYAVVGGPGVHRPSSLQAHWTGGFRSHAGLLLEIDALPMAAEMLIFPTPRRFAHPPRPPKAADPQSKRSRRRAAAEERRAASLGDAEPAAPPDDDRDARRAPPLPVPGPPPWERGEARGEPALSGQDAGQLAPEVEPAAALTAPRASTAVVAAVNAEWDFDAAVAAQECEEETQVFDVSQQGGGMVEGPLTASPCVTLALFGESAAVSSPAMVHHAVDNDAEQAETVHVAAARNAVQPPPAEPPSAEVCAAALEEAQAAAARQAPAHWCAPPAFVAESIAYHVTQDDALALGVKWGRWTAALEGYLVRVLGIPAELQHLYCGRGAPREPRTVRVRAPQAAAPMADRAAAWWSTAEALADALQRQGHRAASEQPVAAASAVASEAARRLRAHADALPRDGPLPLDAGTFLGWQAALRQAPEWPADRARSMHAAIGQVTARMERAEARARLREFQAWLCQAAASQPSRAIRWSQPRPLAAQDYGRPAIPPG